MYRTHLIGALHRARLSYLSTGDENRTIKFGEEILKKFRDIKHYS
jgi:hypothetical protein